jgi:uncharacterized protein YlbG (UPF0298 family)
MVKRRSLIVYYRSPKALKHIEQFAHITYHNNKRHYAVCYINDDNVTETIKQITNHKLIKRVEESLFATEDYQLDLNVK